MQAYTKVLDDLISEFKKLPGVGPKTAERFAFYILKAKKEEARALANALMKVKDSIGNCKVCNNLSESQICTICADSKRERTQICIVEDPKDVMSLERSGGYRGLYHVLLGVLSPLDGVGPSDLKIDALMERVKKGDIKEVVIATGADTEGETTALYLTQLLKPLGIKTTRIAYGIPVGSSIEYSDQATLAKAMEGRREL